MFHGSPITGGTWVLSTVISYLTIVYHLQLHGTAVTPVLAVTILAVDCMFEFLLVLPLHLLLPDEQAYSQIPI